MASFVGTMSSDVLRRTTRQEKDKEEEEEEALWPSLEAIIALTMVVASMATAITIIGTRAAINGMNGAIQHGVAEVNLQKVTASLAKEVREASLASCGEAVDRGILHPTGSVRSQEKRVAGNQTRREK